MSYTPRQLFLERLSSLGYGRGWMLRRLLAGDRDTLNAVLRAYAWAVDMPGYAEHARLSALRAQSVALASVAALLPEDGSDDGAVFDFLVAEDAHASREAAA